MPVWEHAGFCKGPRLPNYLFERIFVLAAMKTAGPIHIGTSGWHYRHWQGPFYPETLGTEGFLEFYARHFHTVEINNSFYQLPTERALSTWRDSVPPGFIFAVKGSRFITHMKKLKDPERSLAPFLEKVALLKDKLGPILFQLPPGWHFNRERLAAFLTALPETWRYTLEFRDQSWINSQVLDLLTQHNVAFCIYDLAGYLSPLEITADFVYIRLHGPGGPYQGRYLAQPLERWAGTIAAWSRQGREVFCYFDNDEAGFAPQNAWELQNLLINR
ncbi:MAG: DUF72 domain-containing protein [Desulfobaccales bacterium]